MRTILSSLLAAAFVLTASLSMAFDAKHFAQLKRTKKCPRCDLRFVQLRIADLRGADLRNANLYGAKLFAADLRSADLRGADLRIADLRFA